MPVDLNSRSMLSDRINVLIDDAIYLNHAWDAPREYLGISVVGNPCDRAVQYQYLATLKQIPEVKFEPRTRRIFGRGHIYEAEARKWLQDAGFVFYPEPAEISDFGGKLKGHVDGVITGFTGASCPISLPSLWECKTLGTKYWKKLEKEGLKEYSPTYWSQLHAYCGYFGLANCLYTAVNSDSMELSHNLYPYDPAELDLVKAKAARVFTATEMGELLPRCTSDPAFYLCSWCPFREACWK